jgi:8-oxo-dGTP pyrophosphatase MutT (NUDIX family)
MFSKKKYTYCNNCDKPGHEYKNCQSPITSWGIILVKLNEGLKVDHSITNMKTRGFCIKPKDFRDLELISLYMSSIRFLMVRRKHSLGYIEFMRGRYKPDNVDGINFLFQQMTPEEIKKIGSNDFSDLWKEMWNDDEHKMKYLEKEYDVSESKFNQLRDCKDVDLGLDFYVKNVVPNYKTHEWGFPKGRRSRNESISECALREFTEETGIDLNKIKLINEIEPIEENLIGTNGVKYRHIYFVAELLGDIKVEIKDNSEIGDIGFFSYNDAISMIREYHLEKRDIIINLYMYYIESLISNKTKMIT